MLMYKHREQRHIDAPPERVFAILSDVAHHTELAGSGEVKSIRMLSDGDVRLGSEWDAEEEVKFGRKTQKFVAHSTMCEFEAPQVLSWTSMPPGKPVPRRIQWRYELTPDAKGCDVVEEVEVDMGPAMNILMRVPYRFMRGGIVARGMRRTLENLDTEARTP